VTNNWVLNRPGPRPRSGLLRPSLERGADGGLGDGAERLGGVILVTLQLDAPEAVCAGLDRERGDGQRGAE